MSWNRWGCRPPEDCVPPSGNAAGLAFRRPPVSVPQRHGREWPCDTVLWPAEARSGLALAGLTAEVGWAPRVGWARCVLQVRVRGCDTVRAVRVRVLWVCMCPRVRDRQRMPSDSEEVAASGPVGLAWAWIHLPFSVIFYFS